MRFAMCHADKDGDLADDIGDSLLRTVDEETDYRLLQAAQHHSDMLILLVSEAAAADDAVVEQVRQYRDSKRPIFPVIVEEGGVGRFKSLLGDDLFLPSQHTDLEAQMMALYSAVLDFIETQE